MVVYLIRSFADNRDEGDFAVDPDQLHDKLPQPFRLVDKILNGLFEDAWGLIAKRQSDMEFEANRRHLPKVTINMTSQR